MTLDTILVALETDGEHESLIEAVLNVATSADVSVVLGVVHPEETFESAVQGLDEPARSPDEVAKRSESVRSAIERFEAEGVSCKVRGAVGDPDELLVSMAEQIAADQLFIQGRKRTPAGKALFGSTAQAVLLNAPCPVTFVRQ
ncbi:universal stress protein [Halalkalicoccus sp. NIPERK01]|uniref:universal stress protein n=1 Tax=Halalkalicoccus sp. NIPERK01 TaxID=3053469 RepID=UPI00256F4DD4|nr:universal stress protein [Halalkalicoccus sp. NIPERK01]MDL5363269.1 universal stress protein [Halalkalicoccus sp. NIPERK01]